MAKKIYKDEDEIEQPDAPAPESQDAGDWREVALFVCAKCGQEKRSQAHRDFVCRQCADA